MIMNIDRVLRSGCSALYSQCGGQNWSGPTCCTGSTCTYSNPYYSQCLLPASSSSSSSSTTTANSPSSTTTNTPTTTQGSSSTSSSTTSTSTSASSANREYLESVVVWIDICS
jgi:hypothetical protein